MRVLILEDDAIIGALIADFLEDTGDTPVGPFAENSPAIAAALAETIDAALLDVSLKGETDFQVADLLLAKGIPFAFSTGHDPRDLPARFSGTPALLKPFDFAQFQNVMAALTKASLQNQR